MEPGNPVVAATKPKKRESAFGDEVDELGARGVWELVRHIVVTFSHVEGSFPDYNNLENENGSTK